MIRTFKALSALLSYPTADLQAAAGDIATALADDRLLPEEALADLGPLLDGLARDDLYDLQEAYVFLFDRSRSLSLNLFEHIHGESRDRGQAMVDLLETYRAGGFELEGPELPDHLPVLLEFLSRRPLTEGRALLADAAHIVAAMAERLDRRGARYAAALRAVCALSAERPDAAALAALTAEPMDDPSDLAALDAVWEEAAVTFGPDPDAGCPASRDMLNRMAVPAPHAAE
jgi:nitrate reductase molybdenum cofactor assembly chaperone NarJ/NarW